MLKRSFGSVKIFSLDRAAIREALRRHIDTRYRPDPNVVAVYLFGSFARGRPSRAAMSICSSSSSAIRGRRATGFLTICRAAFRSAWT